MYPVPTSDSDIIYRATQTLFDLSPDHEGEYSLVGNFREGDIYQLNFEYQLVLGHLTALPEKTALFEFYRPKGFVKSGYLILNIDENGIHTKKCRTKQPYEVARYFDFHNFNVDIFTKK